MTGRCRVAVVEDEALARASLVDIVSGIDDLELVGAAGDGDEAVRVLEAARPDLVFLDVEMPGRTGLAVLAGLSFRPAVIITTAYEEYAVAAFDLDVVDYLRKPFGRDRVLRAVARVRRRLASPSTGSGVATTTGSTSGSRPDPMTRIFVRDGETMVPVEVAAIVRLEAAGDYVEAHASGHRHLLHLTLTELLDRLDAGRFQRIHRSHAVNLDHVDAIHAHDERRLRVVLSDGSEVVASREGTKLLRALAL